MAALAFDIQAGHIITVGLAVLGYLVVSLIAWGKMTSDVKMIKDRQVEMPTKSDLVAAVATMKADLYRLLDERRVGERDRRHEDERG